MMRLLATTAVAALLLGNDCEAQPSACPDVPTTGCSVCGTGMCVTADDGIFSFPGQQEAPCGQLQQAGYDGLVPLDLCPILPTLAELGVCACMSSVPVAPTDAPAPSDAPIEPPTDDAGPTPCPDVPATGCSVCGTGMCVTADDGIFSFPGQQEAPCGQLQQAGYDGLVPLDLCPILPTLAELGVCACMSSVPAAPTDAPAPSDAPIEPPTDAPVVEPTSCPDVPATGCSICGAGMCVTAPEEVFMFPGQPAAPCWILQQAGYDGNIPLATCPIISTLLEVEVCACMSSVPGVAPDPATPPTGAPVAPPTAPPAAAPTDAPAPTDPPVVATAPTNAPVVAPTNTPVVAPTVMPVEAAPVVFTPRPIGDVGDDDDDDDQGKGKGKKGSKKRKW